METSKTLGPLNIDREGFVTHPATPDNTEFFQIGHPCSQSLLRPSKHIC